MSTKEVPLISAIRNECIFVCSGENVITNDFCLRLRFLDFSIVDTSGHVFPESYDVEGVMWKLVLEIRNIGDVEFEPNSMPYLFRIKDSDACTYSFRDMSKIGSLDRDEQFRRFKSSAKAVLPKFGAIGAIAIELPDQDSNYVITPAHDYRLEEI